MRTGVLGGTFDPPHIGHLIIAQDAFQALALDRVLFVVASVPPHKRERQFSSADVRFEMVRAAIAGDDRFEACDIEIEREGTSYTVDTLAALKSGNRGELFLLLGADQFRDFHTWREPERIAELASLVLVARAGIQERPAIEIEHLTVDVTRIDVSSTEIRRRVAEGVEIRYLVAPKVEEIIRERRLYQPGSGRTPKGT